MFKLRGYQQHWIDQVDASLAENRRVMGQLPTGGGKTVVAGALLAEHARRRPNAAHAWLTHRDVLRSQTAASLRQWGLRLVDFSTMSASEREWRPGHVHIVSTGLRTLPEWTSDGLTGRVAAGLLVVDEAHHSTAAKSWAPKIQMWPGDVLGVTATPWRLSAKQGFEHLFNDLVTGPSVQDLTAAGALAHAEVIYPQRWHIDRDRLEKNSVGEISGASAAAEQDRLLHIASAAEWHSYECDAAGLDADTTRTLWFCSTVTAARQLADHLTERGQRAAIIAADTPSKERARIVDDLKAGRLQHVTSCEVLTEGLDVPAVDVAVMLRPTESLALHLQMCGRALRPPGPVLILDAAGNSLAHGLPEQPRQWTLKPRESAPAPDDGTPWTCQCVWDCGRVMHSATRQCGRCQRPQMKLCTGCARHRRLTKFATLDLEPAECDECKQLAVRQIQTRSYEKAEELTKVLTDKLRQGVALGAWGLSSKGNPRIRQVRKDGVTWIAVTRKGMVLRCPPGSDQWEKLGPLTGPLIAELSLTRRGD